MLDYNKRHHLVTKRDEAYKDSKQLFRTLNSLLGNKNENPLLTGTTNDQLAEDFADFFLNKIDEMRKGFKNTPAYQPRQLDTQNLKKFTPVTQNQLEKMSEQCQLKSVN